jgi:hypothetical protein
MANFNFGPIKMKQKIIDHKGKFLLVVMFS